MSDKHLAVSEADQKTDAYADHHEDIEYGGAGAGGPRIQNALHGVPKDVLFANVEAFTQKHSLQEFTDIFKQGALVAQRPLGFDSMPELSADDKISLQYEQDHKWKQTFPLYFTGMSVS